MNTPRLLSYFCMLAALWAGSVRASAQTTYTYNGSTWSPSAPLFASGNSVVVSSGSVAFSALNVYDANSAVVDYNLQPAQSFTAAYSGKLGWVSVVSSPTMQAGKTFTLTVYNGTVTYPPTSLPVLATQNFTTLGGGLTDVIGLTSLVSLTAGQSYTVHITTSETAVSGQGWMRTNVSQDVHSDGVCTYTGYTSINSSNKHDLWFRAGYDLELNGLSIASGASVTLDGSDLHLSGTLANSGTLTLAASEGTYAQLKVSGLVQGSGQVVQNQYLKGTGYHALASSMATGFTTTSGNSAALFAYDASLGNYVNSPNLTNPGMGYFGKLDATGGFATTAGTFSVTGVPNTTHSYNFGYSATVANGGSGSGWNLVGNPYPCGLDWNSVIASNPGQNVNNAVYIWEPSSAIYHYYVNGILPPPTGAVLASAGVIAPLQAFWVQATQPNAVIATNMAAHGVNTVPAEFFKQAPDNLHLTLTELSVSGPRDWAWVLNQPTASPGFDGEFDAWKLPNGVNKPSIAVVDDDQYMAVDALDLSQPQCLDLEVRGQLGERYQIDLDQTVTGDCYRVLLEDHLTQTVTDLSNSPYDFEHSGWTSESPRFSLWFTPGVAMDVSEGVPVAVVTNSDWVMHSQGRWTASPSHCEREVQVYSQMGMLCFEASLDSADPHFDFVTPSGTYLVVLTGPSTRSAHHVIVAR